MVQTVIRWTLWALAGLAAVLAWSLDLEPSLGPDRPLAELPPGRRQVLLLAEFHSHDLTAFGWTAPDPWGWNIPRMHLVDKDSHPVVLASALGRAADGLTTDPFPVLDTAEESAARVALEQTLQKVHDWDAVDLPVSEVLKELSQTLGTTLQTDFSTDSRVSMCGRMRNGTALDIAAQCFGANRALLGLGRLRLNRVESTVSYQEEWWLLPPGASKERAAAITFDRAACRLLCGLVTVRLHPWPSYGTELSKLIQAPINPPRPSKDARPAGPHDRVIQIPAGAISMGELARLLAKQTGGAVWAGGQNDRPAEFAQPFKGKLSELSVTSSPIRLRFHAETVELVATSRWYGHTEGARMYWQFYPLRGLDACWANAERLGEGDPVTGRGLSASRSGPLCAALGAALPGEFHADPEGLYACLTGYHHDQLARILAPDARFLQAVYRVERATGQARARALQAAIADEDPLAAAFALWNLDDSTVPLDRGPLLRLLEPDRLPRGGHHDLRALAWAGCRRWCRTADVAAAVGRIVPMEAGTRGPTLGDVAQWAFEAEVPEFDAALTDWLAGMLPRASFPEESLTFAARLAQRPAGREALRDPVLDAFEKRSFVLMQPSDLTPLLLEALRDSRPERRRQACRLLGESTFVERPSADWILNEVQRALERLRYDPLVADAVPAALQKFSP